MADASTKAGVTNTTPKSCAEVNCDCNTMWSLAQQFSTRRLCVETGEHTGKLLKNYQVRARRIAATYARFYLELEEGGDPTKRGRYYWMALGAFASKTVACTFDAWQVKTMSVGIDTVWEGLGQGNLWLFCDISGWHWYRNMHPASFEKCLNERNSRNYEKPAREQINKLPWSKSSLEIIKGFAVTPEVIRGFAKVKEFEAGGEDDALADIQFDHLIALAEHEQGNILQRLIYDDAAFAGWVKKQRAVPRRLSPKLELVFTHQCSTIHDEVKSVAPENTSLEDYSSRMNWIHLAAKKFHHLMRKKESFMLSALTNMVQWVALPDQIKWDWFDDKK